MRARQSHGRNLQRSLRTWRKVEDPHSSCIHSHDHNGGPPLDEPAEHVPEWGNAGIRTYFGWKRAYNQVWKSVPHSIMLRRLQKAQACGLTYEEYTLHLLDTGRYLQPDDEHVIADIIARREPRQS